MPDELLVPAIGVVLAGPALAVALPLLATLLLLGTLVWRRGLAGYSSSGN